MQIGGRSPKIQIHVETDPKIDIHKRLKTEKLSIMNKIRRKYPFTKSKQRIGLFVSALVLCIHMIRWLWIEIITNQFIAYPMLSTWLSRYSNGMLYSLSKLVFIDDPSMS